MGEKVSTTFYQRVRRAVALYRSRFQPNLPTKGGSESSMDRFIPYVPQTKRDRSKPRKDKHRMVDEDAVDRQLSSDNILKDYLDSQGGGSSGEQFNLDGLFEFDFPPTKGGSNEVPDFPRGRGWSMEALETSKQEARMARFKAEVADKEIAHLKNELEGSRRRERESFEKEVNHAYRALQGACGLSRVSWNRGWFVPYAASDYSFTNEYAKQTGNMAEKDEKDKDLKIYEVEEEIWEQ
ncbi:hypothetical protein DY000_02039721 [Brassica cretica]|uniref:Uncharacterized protein n=1 Tax=Brassica cretica TaxID=69181 RepID=A0ABQ7BDY7_BRACR|nr:hypothetical protein DY000_02039721 [Brassica cretica]